MGTTPCVLRPRELDDPHQNEKMDESIWDGRKPTKRDLEKMKHRNTGKKFKEVTVKITIRPSPSLLYKS